MTAMRRFAPTALSVALCCLALPGCDREYPWETSSTPTASMLRPGSEGSTTDVADDAGDARLRSGEPAPGYLDHLGATVMPADEHHLLFIDHVAAPFPPDAPVPKGDAAIGWSFCLDTDPAYAGVGFPMDSVRPCEFVLRVQWDGRNVQAFLIDRRPLMEGSRATFRSIQPTWQDRSLELLIPLQDLGSPSGFEWSISTEEFRSGDTEAVSHVDELPEGANAKPVVWRA